MAARFELRRVRVPPMALPLVGLAREVIGQLDNDLPIASSAEEEVHDSMPQHSSEAHWSLRTALGQPQNESHRAGETLPVRRLVRQRTATI